MTLVIVILLIFLCLISFIEYFSGLLSIVCFVESLKSKKEFFEFIKGLFKKERKYRVITPTSSEVCNLEHLSRKFSSQCEIFEISDKEIYLGRISKVAAIHIQTSILEYSMREAFSDKITPEIDYIIKLGKEYVENSGYLEKDKLSKAYSDTFETLQDSSLFDLKKYDSISCSRYLIMMMGDYNYDYVNLYNDRLSERLANFLSIHFRLSFSNFILSLLYTIRLMKALKRKEFRRQGQFILDFLKSDKHLFMV